MPEVLRDYQILYLAASDPSRAALRVSGMVSIVCNARRNLGRNPWPFNGMIRSWEGLIRLIYRTELLQHGASGPLPEPPIPPVHEAGPDGLQIAALDSVGLLQEEGLRMENCIFGYIEAFYLEKFMPIGLCRLNGRRCSCPRMEEESGKSARPCWPRMNGRFRRRRGSFLKHGFKKRGSSRQESEQNWLGPQDALISDLKFTVAESFRMWKIPFREGRSYM